MNICLFVISGVWKLANQVSFFLSHNVFTKSFGKYQFPHKFVNLSIMITNMKNTLTDMCGNLLLQNDFI